MSSFNLFCYVYSRQELKRLAQCSNSATRWDLTRHPVFISIQIKSFHDSMHVFCKLCHNASLFIGAPVNVIQTYKFHSVTPLAMPFSANSSAKTSIIMPMTWLGSCDLGGDISFRGGGSENIGRPVLVHDKNLHRRYTYTLLHVTYILCFMYLLFQNLFDIIIVQTYLCTINWCSEPQCVVSGGGSSLH